MAKWTVVTQWYSMTYKANTVVLSFKDIKHIKVSWYSQLIPSLTLPCTVLFCKGYNTKTMHYTEKDVTFTENKYKKKKTFKCYSENVLIG